MAATPVDQEPEIPERLKRYAQLPGPAPRVRLRVLPPEEGFRRKSTERAAKEFARLRPWFNVLTSAQRSVAEMRAAGMTIGQTIDRHGSGAPTAASHALKRLHKAEKAGPGTTDTSGDLSYPEDVERPRTRGDCANQPRPCPFVSCAHHLYLDVNRLTGAIKMNFPHLEPWELRESCSLDVADRSGVTLEEVGAILNLTRERIRQVEVRGLEMIKAADNGQLSAPIERESWSTGHAGAKAGCP